MGTYSKSNFEAIGAAIGTDASVVANYESRFDAAARWYRLDRQSPRRLTPHELHRSLDQIARAARRLLKHLAIDDPHDAADGPGDRTILNVLVEAEDGTEIGLARATERIARLVEIFEAINAARELQRRAVLAKEDVRQIGELIVPKQHQGDIAVNDWIASMLAIYGDVTGKEPATSVGGPGRSNDGVASGPLIRFLEIAGKPLGIIFSADAWRSRVRTVLDQSHKQN